MMMKNSSWMLMMTMIIASSFVLFASATTGNVTTSAAGNATTTAAAATSATTPASNTTAAAPNTTTTEPPTTPTPNTTTTQPPTTTVPPTTTPANPFVCHDKPVTITAGICAGKSFPFQWCARNKTFDAEYDAAAANFTARVNAVNATALTDYLNTTFCPEHGATFVDANLDYFCLVQSVEAMSCTLNVVTAEGVCPEFAIPSCSLIQRSLQVNCRGGVVDPSKEHCSTTGGWGQTSCFQGTLTTGACGTVTKSTCAISAADADMAFAALSTRSGATNVSGLADWSNAHYCSLGGGRVVNVTALNVTDVCSELSNTISCGPQCTGQTFLNAPIPSISTPICCDQCNLFYTAACTGGDVNAACQKKQCANTNCWGFRRVTNPPPMTATTTPGSTSPTTPEEPKKGGLGTGPIVGIVIGVVLVVGGSGGFIYYRKKKAAVKDTAMREYASFTTD